MKMGEMLLIEGGENSWKRRSQNRDRLLVRELRHSVRSIHLRTDVRKDGNDTGL